MVFPSVTHGPRVGSAVPKPPPIFFKPEELRHKEIKRAVCVLCAQRPHRGVRVKLGNGAFISCKTSLDQCSVVSVKPFSAAQQLLEGFGLSPRRHLCCDQHCCCEPSTFITPRRSRAGGTGGEEHHKRDTTHPGLLSAPSLLAALVISSKGSRALLSLACQPELTFELC